jgi:hypothetical protein
MTTFFTIFLLLLQFFLISPLRAEKTAPISPAEFDQVKSLLCDPDTVDQLKVIHQVCGTESFVSLAEDLDGDGKPERLVFGPSGVCGAHGNCPLYLLKPVGTGWEVFPKTACKGEDCLGWANSFATEVLPAKHKGYRDLLIGADMGSFFWTKTVYQWDGSHYRMNPSGITYFLVDSKVQLVKVSKARWEQCSHSGKNCLQ